MTADSWSDAWFLLAASRAGRRGRLSDVIGEGDYLNHAIFTKHEIEHAVRRLIDTNLLIVNGADTFQVTSAGKKLVRSVARPSERGWVKEISRLADEINSTAALERAPITQWTIQASVLEAAYHRYTAEMQEGMRRLDRMPRPIRWVQLHFWLALAALWRILRR